MKMTVHVVLVNVVKISFNGFSFGENDVSLNLIDVAKITFSLISIDVVKITVPNV